MSKGYKTLLLVLTLVLLTGCGARLVPVPREETAAQTPGEVPPLPTPTPLLSPPPEAVPSGTPVPSPTPRVSRSVKTVPGVEHYPPRLPVDWGEEESAPAAETMVRAGTYTVRGGDCLWTIAEELYGSGSQWRGLWEANRESVADPSLVLIGQVLELPEGEE